MRAVAVLAGALVLAGCKSTPGPQETPAARHCADRGGQLRFETEFGELGICQFEGDRQCEQWAMLRGDCPRGGIPVAGYATSSERYCAIRGGTLQRGACALPPAGTYVATAGDRISTLELDMLGGATLATPGKSTVRGAWAREGGFMTVFTGKERIVFRYEAQRLVPREWDRSVWGEAGLETFTRAATR